MRWSLVLLVLAALGCSHTVVGFGFAEAGAGGQLAAAGGPGSAGASGGSDVGGHAGGAALTGGSGGSGSVAGASAGAGAPAGGAPGTGGEDTGGAPAGGSSTGGVTSTGGSTGGSTTGGMPATGGSAPCSASDERLNTSTGHCYRHVWTAPLAYAAAESDCESWGGTLAAINSQAEQDFIRNSMPLTNSGSWIGLNDIASEGSFVWQTGEAVSYTHWASGQPDNLSNEDCAALLGLWANPSTNIGAWDDVACSSALPYYCERATP